MRDVRPHALSFFIDLLRIHVRNQRRRRLHHRLAPAFQISALLHRGLAHAVVLGHRRRRRPALIVPPRRRPHFRRVMPPHRDAPHARRRAQRPARLHAQPLAEPLHAAHACVPRALPPLLLLRLPRPRQLSASAVPRVDRVNRNAVLRRDRFAGHARIVRIDQLPLLLADLPAPLPAARTFSSPSRRLGEVARRRRRRDGGGSDRCLNCPDPNLPLTASIIRPGDFLNLLVHAGIIRPCRPR